MIIEERDITNQEKYEAELENARDAALESSRLKSAFLANMSHEVRTPLNVILGYVDVIGDHMAESGDKTQHQYLEAAARAGKRLITTMNAILEYSKIEAGGLECNPQLLHLSDLVNSQVNDFRPLAIRKRIDLAFVDEAPGARIVADEYCVSSALQNLIGNAIKFTERGRVDVRQSRQDGEVKLQISDTGIGIEEKFLPKLFQPFVQEESSFARKFEGNGLGLALTKRFLDANQARISVSSEKGAWTVFTIHFPAESKLKGRPAGDPTVEAPPDLPRLLLVEDDPDTQVLMRTLLQSVFEVRVAPSGAAVRKIVDENLTIDAVMMDISIRGEEDGLDLTRFLRCQARFRALPIIAVTAHASLKHQRMALEAGCDAVLTKPVTRAQILSTLARVSASLVRSVSARP